MFKSLVFSFILWLVTVPVFSQTYLKMDLWVDRVPVTNDSTTAPQCLYQNVLMYVDPQRIGVVTTTDTVALIVEKDLPGTKLYCKDLVTGDSFVYEGYIGGDGFIFFITPDTKKPFKSKYALIYSTIPCLNERGN